jgi:signal transduction histidine kinase
MIELRNHTEAHYAMLTGDIVLNMQAYFSDELVCVYANAAFADWCDRFPEQIEGRITLPELLGGEYKYFDRSVSEVLGGRPQNFEFSRADSSGVGMRYTRVRLVPHVVFGKTKGFVIESEDITAAKSLAMELHLNNEVIVKQNERLLNFANIVTHNLMNYAGNLESTLELYSQETGAVEREELFNLLKDISTSFTSSLKALREVVKFQNHGSLPMQRVNLHSYVTNATEVLRPQINASNAVIKNYVSRDVYVEAVPAYIESIVLNFLSNTIKYRHSERRPEVELKSMVVGNEAVLSIRDNGIGIDLERHRKKLYGLYETFSRNADASGIGLFITKYQVDTMGGYIGVESEVGKGTEFRVYLRADRSK